MTNNASLFRGKHVRTGLKRLWRNTLTTIHRPRSGWSPPPVLVVLRPIERCNLTCKMCFERGENVVTDSWSASSETPELSERRFVALVDDLAVFTPTFYITGGEPLLADSLVPIVSAIKAHGQYVSLNTNAVLLKNKARELVEAGLDKIIVSIDGPPDIHDSIRGEVFDDIADGIAVVNSLKKEKGVKTPVLRVQCVISRYNSERLLDTLDTTRGLGIGEIRFQHPMFTFSKEDYFLDDFIKSISKRARISTCLFPGNGLDPVLVRDQLGKIRQRAGRGLRMGFEPDLRPADIEGYYQDACHPFHNTCFSPWRRLVVSSRGEMSPCQGLVLAEYPETSPAEAWNSEPFRKLRRRILDTGLFPHCLRCCHREYYPPKIRLDIS